MKHCVMLEECRCIVTSAKKMCSTGGEVTCNRSDLQYHMPDLTCSHRSESERFGHSQIQAVTVKLSNDGFLLDKSTETKIKSSMIKFHFCCWLEIYESLNIAVTPWLFSIDITEAFQYRQYLHVCLQNLTEVGLSFSSE